MNNNEEEILNLFFDFPTTRFSLREIARITKIHPNIVSKVVRMLTKSTFLLVEKKKHAFEVTANLENKNFIRKKRAKNFDKIYDCGIIEFLEEKLHPNSISVIGSYGRGEDIEKSDIDLVIIGTEDKEINLEKFEKLLHRKIQIHIMEYDNMANEFYTNLINGMLLYGYLTRK